MRATSSSPGQMADAGGDQFHGRPMDAGWSAWRMTPEAGRTRSGSRPLMSPKNRSRGDQTAFTVSIEAREGVTTGSLGA